MKPLSDKTMLFVSQLTTLNESRFQTCELAAFFRTILCTMLCNSCAVLLSFSWGFWYVSDASSLPLEYEVWVGQICCDSLSKVWVHCRWFPYGAVIDDS